MFAPRSRSASPDPERVDILLVDDRPASLLALQSALEPLGQNLYCARSGLEALRLLLERQFAVILLDVNMPEMDGFETAALIRARPRTRHTPILFVSAYANEEWVSRGYALGAVDFIFAPVVPNVLRTKVGAFVDLILMNGKIERQAESLRRRKAQWRRLTEASLAIHTAGSFDEMLRIVAHTARDLVNAHQAYATVAIDDPKARYTAASLSKRYAAWRTHAEPPDVSVFEDAAMGPVRLSNAETAERVARSGGAADPARPPLRGYLSVPLVGRDGRRLGTIQLSDAADGEFGPGDEAIVEPLARMAASAIENTLYCDAREANRLKDEFLATLSHELRTPLNAVVGWTQLLRVRQLDERDLSHALDVIERNVRTQARMIEDLLDVSRITTGKMRLERLRAPLAPVVQAAIDTVHLAADAKHVEIACQIDEPDAMADIDPDRLQQVMTNLLGNAVKFTPAAGRITVALDRLGADWRVRVADTGDGIEADLLPHVFERFRQGSSGSARGHGGLGMGLAIARHLVELHGGTIEASSDGPGRGALFTVRVPVPDVVQNLRGLRVLVVEDEPDGRTLLCEMLSRHEARVTGVDSVAAALDALRRDEHDLVISDIAMPEEDGYALVRRIRRGEAGRGDLPVIAVTAQARTEDRDRALHAGFCAHVSKPVDPSRLIGAVRRFASHTPA